MWKENFIRLTSSYLILPPLLWPCLALVTLELLFTLAPWLTLTVTGIAYFICIYRFPVKNAEILKKWMWRTICVLNARYNWALGLHSKLAESPCTVLRQDCPASPLHVALAWPGLKPSLSLAELSDLKCAPYFQILNLLSSWPNIIQKSSGILSQDDQVTDFFQRFLSSCLLSSSQFSSKNSSNSTTDDFGCIPTKFRWCGENAGFLILSNEECPFWLRRSELQRLPKKTQNAAGRGKEVEIGSTFLPQPALLRCSS